MGREVIEIRDQIYNRVLDTRNVESLIQTEAFESAIEDSDLDEVNRVKIMINQCCCENKLIRIQSFKALKSWIKKKNEVDITFQELRDEARALGIKYYTKLSRSLLLARVIEARKHLHDTNRSDFESIIRDSDTID